MAASELVEKAGQMPATLGEDYTYEWKDLVADAKESNRTMEVNTEHDISFAASWTHMRLCGALAVAEGRMPNHVEGWHFG